LGGKGRDRKEEKEDGLIFAALENWGHYSVQLTFRRTSRNLLLVQIYQTNTETDSAKSLSINMDERQAYTLREYLNRFIEGRL
jgi:hypothetical protein